MKNNRIDSRKKILFSNFFSLFVLQLVTYAIPLISLPYLVSTLGVERFGLIMFAQSIMVFINVFIDYGFNLSATREISLYRNDKEKLTEIYSSVLILKIALLLVSFLVMTAFVFSIDRFRGDVYIYYLSFLSVIGEALFPVWYFQGIEKMKYITFINVVSKLSFLFSIFIFVNKQDDYFLVPFLNGMGSIVAGIYSLLLLRLKFNQVFVFQALCILKSYFKDSTHYFLSRVSVSIYTSANNFILGVFTTNTMVGYYSIADKLYQSIQSLYSPVIQALYPYFTKENNILFFKKIFYSVIFLNFFAVFVIFLSGDVILKLLFESGISDSSISIFNILLVANLFVVPSILIGYPLLGARGFAKDVNKSVIYGSILHIIFLLFLVLTNNISAYSIASMVIITELFVFLFRVYKVYHHKLWN